MLHASLVLFKRPIFDAVSYLFPREKCVERMSRWEDRSASTSPRPTCYFLVRW